jgi:hypothetical protein
VTVLLLLAWLQDPDAQIAEMVRAWERNRQDPAAARTLATQLQARLEAGAPAATAALIAANRDLPVEARLVAAMSLARSNDARAAEAARGLGPAASDELLFATGDDESARLLGERVRSGSDREQQLREIDYLGRLGTPAAKAALTAAVADESLAEEIRLAAAHQLRPTLDPRQVMASLAQIRPDGMTQPASVERAPAAAKAVERSVPAAPARKPAPAPSREGSSTRTNIILASVAAGLSILLLATRKKA